MKKEILLKKSFLLLLSVITVLCCFSWSTFAALPDNGISPLWVSINDAEVTLEFLDGGEGIAQGTATKQSTASKIEGTLVLYEQDGDEWVYTDEWYNSKTRGTLSVSGEFTAVSGVTYKAEFTVTAYTNDVPETETFECIKTCP